MMLGLLRRRIAILLVRMGIFESRDGLANKEADDSYINCKRAEEIGWNTVHLVEEGDKLPRTPACKYQIRHLEELRSIFPQHFKSSSGRE